MKKLIPALCMLLIAAALMGTSTFAWFSMNTEVTAETMQIKAVTDSTNLYIAKGASIGLAALSATAVTDLSVSEEVLPANLTGTSGEVTIQVPSAYESDSEPDVDFAGTPSAWTTIGKLTGAEATSKSSYALSDYCAYAYVTIGRKADTNDTKYNLTPTCTITLTGASNLNKALRVGLIINNTFYSSNDKNVATGTITCEFNSIELTDNKAYSACLVLWYEGNDSDCISNNAISLQNNSAAWKFASANAS